MRNPITEKEIMNRLEAACQAGFQLMKQNKITPYQYDALNEAIFNIETKILESE